MSFPSSPVDDVVAAAAVQRVDAAAAGQGLRRRTGVVALEVVLAAAAGDRGDVAVAGVARVVVGSVSEVDGHARQADVERELVVAARIAGDDVVERGRGAADLVVVVDGVEP